MRLNQNTVAVAGIGVGVAGLIIAGISLLVDMGSLGLNVVQSQPSSNVRVKQTDRFSCELREETNIWTVMYDNGKKKQPWLEIEKTMGGGWSTPRRCDKIQERLEYYRKDGLLSLEYRNDPNTPKQQVICAKTKLNNNGCPVLLTLDVGVDGYKALSDMTKALWNGETVQQNTEGKLANSNFSRDLPVVYLQPFLTKEDRLAGK
ncbi:MAG: COP23 domain-containing protein [Cyanobacteria bacterium P01_H01_bin.35]